MYGRFLDNMLRTYSLSLELILARKYHPLILPHFATCATTPLHRTRRHWIVESHTKCVQWYLMAGRCSDNGCRLCAWEEMYKGREIKKIKLDGRPPENPIRNLVQHIEMVAPPPLVPFTEEPPSFVGNPTSWVSAMCPLSGNPQQSSRVSYMWIYSLFQTLLCLARSQACMNFCVPVVMGIT